MNVLPRHELVHEDGRRVFVYGTLEAGSSLADSGAETWFGGIHRRFDAVTREWVAMSPARNVRPLDTADRGGDDVMKRLKSVQRRAGEARSPAAPTVP